MIRENRTHFDLYIAELMYDDFVINKLKFNQIVSDRINKSFKEYINFLLKYKNTK